jgi:hypothetical protein
MVRGMHEAMVTDVLRAIEIKVASISTISTMKQLQHRGNVLQFLSNFVSILYIYISFLFLKPYLPNFPDSRT